MFTSRITYGQRLCFQTQKVEENEKTDAEVKLHFRLVTNGDKFEEGVKEEAKSVGIKIMKGVLSSNWEKKSDWKVVKITEEL
jgi:hypothetical protein